MDTKILIVDNVLGQLRALENILKGLGYKQIHSSKNAKEAMSFLVSNADAGLVIAEWDLPDRSGLDLLFLLKSNEKLKVIPIVLVVKGKSAESILKAFQAGAVGVIVKPYKTEIIEQKIKSILNHCDQSAKNSEKEQPQLPVDIAEPIS